MNYYRKIEKSVNNLKYKMQIAALNLKIRENNDKIDKLLTVDENIKNDIKTINKNILKNLNNTSINRKDIDLYDSIINSHISQIDTINNEILDLKKIIIR